MKSLKEWQAKYDALEPDAEDYMVDYVLGGIERASLSEEFKGMVLFEFEPLTKECIEKAPESFYIKLHTGQKYVYYSSKALLIPLLKWGKRGQKVFLPPHSFMKYFSPILKQN